jgi:hypothetical protein
MVQQQFSQRSNDHLAANSCPGAEKADPTCLVQGAKLIQVGRGI